MIINRSQGHAALNFRRIEAISEENEEEIKIINQADETPMTNNVSHWFSPKINDTVLFWSEAFTNFASKFTKTLAEMPIKIASNIDTVLEAGLKLNADLMGVTEAAIAAEQLNALANIEMAEENAYMFSSIYDINRQDLFEYDDSSLMQIHNEIIHAKLHSTDDIISAIKKALEEDEIYAFSEMSFTRDAIKNASRYCLDPQQKKKFHFDIIFLYKSMLKFYREISSDHYNLYRVEKNTVDFPKNLFSRIEFLKQLILDFREVVAIYENEHSLTAPKNIEIKELEAFLHADPAEHYATILGEESEFYKKGMEAVKSAKHLLQFDTLVENLVKMRKLGPEIFEAPYEIKTFAEKHKTIYRIAFFGLNATATLLPAVIKLKETYDKINTPKPLKDKFQISFTHSTPQDHPNENDTETTQQQQTENPEGPPLSNDGDNGFVMR